MSRLALTCPKFLASLATLILCAISVHADVINIEAGPAINRNAIKLFNDGETLFRKGDLEGARHNFDAVIKAEPTFWPAYYGRAEVYLRQHKWDLAIRDCNQLLLQKRTFPEASILRAGANAGAGRYAAALKELNYLVDISHPRLDTHARALAARAQLYSICPDRSFRKPQQAIKDAETACRLTKWNDNAKLTVLAAAYASAGDFDSAIKYQERAISLGTDSSMQAREMQKELGQLKQHKPLKID